LVKAEFDCLRLDAEYQTGSLPIPGGGYIFNLSNKPLGHHDILDVGFEIGF
jgi:hypothetical protein